MYIIPANPNTNGIPHMVLVKTKSVTNAIRRYLGRVGISSIYVSQTEKHEKHLVKL